MFPRLRHGPTSNLGASLEARIAEWRGIREIAIPVEGFLATAPDNLTEGQRKVHCIRAFPLINQEEDGDSSMGNRTWPVEIEYWARWTSADSDQKSGPLCGRR